MLTLPQVKRIVDQSGLRGVQAKQYLKFLQKPEGLSAVVEFVLNPVRLKLYIPELSCYLSFTVAAIRSPWGEHPHGDEACRWARRHFHQRKLEVHVSGCDKGGNFLGDAFHRKQNVALTLLEEGWAELGKGSDRHPSHTTYQQAQQAAQQQRKGMWRDWSPALDTQDEAAEKPLETGNVLVTEVVDGDHFYVQRTDEASQQTLQQIMADCQQCGAQSEAVVPRPGLLATVRFAQDGLWYRVRLQEELGGGRWSLYYLDFGNSESRPLADLRALGRSASAPAQALRCRLALLRVPALVQDCGAEAADTLRELCFGKMLYASFEWRENDVYHVTLGDLKTGININKEMVRLGVAVVYAKKGAKRFEKPLAQLLQAQDEAKGRRASLWRYGDILDASDDEN